MYLTNNIIICQKYIQILTIWNCDSHFADIGEVPKFMFSPPQTRSKTISPNQHHRLLSDTDLI